MQRQGVAQTIAITGGRVVPIEGDPIDGGTVLLRDGKIAAVEGPGFAVPSDAEVVDAAGKWVLPGFIDAHAHAGVSEEAEGWAGQDTNERTDPVTAQVRALDAINPADLGLRDTISGRVLTGQHQPRLSQPDRRADGRDQVLGPHRGRDGDARSRTGLKSALGEEPQARLRQAERDPVDRAGHPRGHPPRRVRRRAELSGQTGRGTVERMPGWSGTSSSRR